MEVNVTGTRVSGAERAERLLIFSLPVQNPAGKTVIISGMGMKRKCCCTHGPALSVTKLKKRSVQLLGKVEDQQHAPDGCVVAANSSDAAMLAE
jgi:hypothetical protein